MQSVCQNAEWTLFSGYLSSPNYPDSFAASTHCSCTLAAKDGSMFTLRTLELHIPFKKRCRYSYFNILILIFLYGFHLPRPHTFDSILNIFL